MDGWTRTDGHVVTDLAQPEAALLRGLVGQIKDMLTERASEAPEDELAALTGIRTGPSTPPEHQALARLLPDFYRTDPETGESDEDEQNAAGAMRSLHEPELIDLKTGVAETVLSTCPAGGGRVELSDEQAQSWLAALNDVRLALGSVLDIDDDTADEPNIDDPSLDELKREHYGAYQWLTWVQDSLVQAVMAD
ncbi:DUF2017 family protein [Allosaccharopolyspora coralli]|uniref:DUF2017 family protein n=1 Tax=Allosaccharopolyspora coralli TaxID=2665642 RepID=A0A5Q3QC47_9PSEU|nr:DUF2017 domain-containing protein [Allosaccharopolyspora coralli]QGK69035.1 DUF2017 family protein [Allosaccharopolyspora coralli]